MCKRRVILPVALSTNFLLPPGASRAADLFRELAKRTTWRKKESVWRNCLDQSRTAQSREGGQITVNVMQAVEFAARRKVDVRFTRTLFGQVFTALRARDPKYLRVALNDRAFECKMAGMNAIDAGGPYREVLERMCEELQSSVLPLFVPSANARAAVGDGRDRHVPAALPASAAARALRLAAYQFVGQLMGLAIRSQNLLPLNLPSIVWKQLTGGEAPTADDVRAIDVLTSQLLQSLKKDTSADVFNMTMRDCQFEVVPNGASEPIALGASAGGGGGGSGGGGDGSTRQQRRRVTAANRDQFHDALLSFRLGEFTEQCAAMRRGLATVVPYLPLALLSWHELERQVCGGGMDLDLLQRHTVYEGFSAADSRARLFWQMMHERFDDAQRAKFLSFVWGRSRLPTSDATWGDRPFKIDAMRARGPVDLALPISHTCFFSIELPDYSTVDVMTERVTFAIINCTSIDGDGSGAGDVNIDVGDDAEL